MVGGDAKRVEVAAGVNGPALDLLRAHVERRAHGDAGLREVVRPALPARARPKSATFTSPERANIRFSGLMSR